MNRLLLILTALILALSGQVLAKNRCESLVLSGGAHLFPYFFHSSDALPDRIDSSTRAMLSRRHGSVGDTVLTALSRAGIAGHVAPPKPWRRMLLEVSRGQIDIIAGALKSDGRQDLLEFSDVIDYSEFHLFVKSKDSFTYRHPEDLKGRRGVKVLGMSFGPEFDDFAFNNLTFEEVPEYSSIFRMVAAGRAFFTVFHRESGGRLVRELGLERDLIMLPNIVAQEPIYVAYSKKSPCQSELAQVRKEIRMMKKKGEIERISSYYQQFLEVNSNREPGIHILVGENR